MYDRTLVTTAFRTPAGAVGEMHRATDMANLVRWQDKQRTTRNDLPGFLGYTPMRARVALLTISSYGYPQPGVTMGEWDRQTHQIAQEALDLDNFEAELTSYQQSEP